MHHDRPRPSRIAPTASFLALALLGAVATAQEGPPRVADGTAGARRIPPGLNFANALLNQRRYELAAEEYEKFLRDTPTGPDAADALYGLARAKLFLFRYDEARRHLTAFLERAPEHQNAGTARFRLGEAAYLQRDWEAARRELETFVGSYPGHPHLDAAYPYLGDVRLALGDPAGAREAYETGLAAYPDGLMADRSRYHLARVLASQGETDAALAALAPLVEGTKPEWSERARLQRGQIEAQAGRLEEAVATFAALEQANPKGASLPEARLRRAEALVGLERPDEAEPVLSALAGDPATPAAVAAQAGYDLGGLLLDVRHRPADALAAFDAAASRSPDARLAPLLLFRSAEALQALDRPAEARPRFLKVADEFPRDAWADRALLAASRLALEAKAFAEARRLAAQLPARYPGSPLRPNARLIEARALRGAGREADAIPLLAALLDDVDVPPEIARAARYDLSLAYKATGRPEKAAETLAALADAPADASAVGAPARYALGQARFEAGQLAEAVEPFEQYLAEEQDGPLAAHALAYLADVHHRLGDEDASRAALDRLVRDFPDSEDLLRLRVRLGEAALQADDPARAVELLRPVAEGPQGDFTARARSALGWALVGLDRHAEAADAFASAVAAAPGGPEAGESRYMKAWSLEKAGRADAALEAYAEAAADGPQAARARLARARLLSRSGRPGEAADALGAYLAAAPDDADGLDAVRVEHAWALRDAGRREESDAAFRDLLASRPASHAVDAARVDLAKLAYADGDPDAVARLLEPLAAPDATADAATAAQALDLLGRVALDRSDWPAARGHFRRLVDLSSEGPDRDQARFWLAESAFHADDPAAAEPEFAALAADAGPDSEPWRATAWLRRIQCLLALKDWPAVLSEADALLARLPEFPQRAEVHYARGRALQSQAAPRFDDARAAYEAAIAAAPASETAARAQFMIGETHFFEKQYREAERAFLAVALTYDLPSLQASALFEAGQVAEADGRPADAAASYRSLLDDFPTDPRAPDARRKLDAITSTPRG